MDNDHISFDELSETSDELIEFEFVVDDGVTLTADTDTTNWYDAYETTLRDLWADEASSQHGVVGIVFVGVLRIQELNREYLGRDRPTDVLSFDLSDDAGSFEGEVYIGVDRAVVQAEEIGCSISDEFARLMIHGVLHLAGHDHNEPDDERRMLRATKRWLEHWRAASADST